MRLLRARKLQLALLWMLIAPLQSFAGSALGSEGTAAAMAAQHCPHHPVQGHALPHSACGMCCCAVPPPQFIVYSDAPLSAGPRPVAPVLLTPPAVVLDRLDRPPR